MRVLLPVLCLLGFVSCLSAEPTNIRDYSLATFDEGAGCIAFFPAGEMLTSGYDENLDRWSLMVWDIPRKKLLRTINTNIEDSRFLDISPNGQLILAAAPFGGVEVFDTTGKPVAQFRAFEFGAAFGLNRNLDVKFLNNDEVLTIAPQNLALRRHIKTDVCKLYWLQGRPTTGASISRETDSLMWVSDSFVYYWKPMLKKPAAVDIPAPNNRFDRVVCSDDGSRLLCATQDSKLSLYDASKSESIKTWTAHRQATFVDLIAIKNNRGFVTACDDGGGSEANVWLSNGDLAVSLRLPRIYCIACNHDSTVLAIGTGNKQICVYDLARILKEAKAKQNKTE